MWKQFAQTLFAVSYTHLDVYKRQHSAMDPETTEGLAKPYYEKVVDVLLAKNEPRYNSALIECYSYLGYRCV